MTEGMNVKDYDYDLPEELIAQDPPEDPARSAGGTDRAGSSGGSFQLPPYGS